MWPAENPFFRVPPPAQPRHPYGLAVALATVAAFAIVILTIAGVFS